MKYTVDKQMLENTIAFFDYVVEENGESDYPGETYHYSLFHDAPVCIDDNLSIWARAKSHIYELFGNKLKIEIPLKNVNVANSNLIRKTVEDFLREKEGEFNIAIHLFLSSLFVDDFYENKLTGDIKFLDVEFKKGRKISSCLSELEPDKKELERQQNLYSQLVQRLQLTGTLVFSIDPIDYYTMSVSSSGWSSCHHPNSCHGAGGLAYMNDEATVIAYIKTDNPVQYFVYDDTIDETTTIEFDNKVWRQIVNINPELTYGVQMKGYPNENFLFNDLVSKHLRKIFEDYHGVEFKTFADNMDDSPEDIQMVNPMLDGQIFYCDYYNANMYDYYVTYCSEFGDRDSFYDKLGVEISKPIIGAEVYCACGCGYPNYSSNAISEVSSEDYYDYFD